MQIMSSILGAIFGASATALVPMALPKVRVKVMQGRFLTYLPPLGRVRSWRNLYIMRATPMRLKSPAEREVLAAAAMKRNRKRKKVLLDIEKLRTV